MSDKDSKKDNKGAEDGRDEHHASFNGKTMVGLKLNLAGVGCSVNVGEAESLEFENCRKSDFFIEYADSILTVRRKKPLLKNIFVLTDADIPRVKITLPARVLKSTKIKLNGAACTVNGLNSKKLTIRNRAANIDLDNVDIGTAKVSIEAGNVKWRSGVLRESMELACAAGNATFEGIPEDFGYDAKLRVGKLSLGSRQISALTAADTKKGTPFFKITCDVGNVSIR